MSLLHRIVALALVIVASAAWSLSAQEAAPSKVENKFHAYSREGHRFPSKLELATNDLDKLHDWVVNARKEKARFHVNLHAEDAKTQANQKLAGYHVYHRGPRLYWEPVGDLVKTEAEANTIADKLTGKYQPIIVGVYK